MITNDCNVDQTNLLSKGTSATFGQKQHNWFYETENCKIKTKTDSYKTQRLEASFTDVNLNQTGPHAELTYSVKNKLLHKQICTLIINPTWRIANQL